MTDEQLIAGAGGKALLNDTLGGCSQAVLGALQETLGIGSRDSFRAATVLSGGVARRGETCGALIGALMALGIERGRDTMADGAAYSRAVTEAQPLIEEFTRTVCARFNLDRPLESTLCRHIQERIFGRWFDLSQDDERQAFLAAGGHDEDRCPLVCALAAEAAASAILKLRRAG
jgi:C_GCAxxG_C_C family probable redox protein